MDVTLVYPAVTVVDAWAVLVPSSATHDMLIEPTAFTVHASDAPVPICVPFAYHLYVVGVNPLLGVASSVMDAPYAGVADEDAKAN